MKKVLVIDDSKTIRTLCEWIYKGQEDVVFTAENEETARALIQRESPDVIFVDYTMPGKDAYAFLSSLRGSGAGLVMVGGEYAPFDPDKAIASGAIEVLMKPFKTTDFFDCVDRVAASPQRQAQEGVAVEPSVPAAPAAPAAPSAEYPAARSGSQPVISLPKTAGGFPPITPKRFNFPGVGSSPHNAAIVPPAHPAQHDTPAHQVQSGLLPVVGAAPTYSRPTDLATPRTPVPSISPAVAQFQAQNQAQIDPALLRAEVIAAVKSMLPSIVNNYLKKLIQAEVKPQLQHWVDARVEALIKK